VVIGLVEVILAVAFATLVYGGYLVRFLAEGIGLFLLGGAITLAVLAWRAGRRGVVGSLQDAAVAVLALIAARVCLETFADPANRAPGMAPTTGPRDAFLVVVAATVIVTVLCGLTFFVLGSFRLGNLVRFVPYPVIGGFLAGTGWLLLKGGVGVAAGTQVTLRTLSQLSHNFLLARWIPAFVTVATGLVERIRRRANAGRLRFELVDLGRVTGMDTSVVMAFTNVALLAKARGVRAPALRRERRRTSEASSWRRDASRGSGPVRAGPRSRAPAVPGGAARGTGRVVREVARGAVRAAAATAGLLRARKHPPGNRADPAG
jgi:MFS superfamily sulfate permease-like transporter